MGFDFERVIGENKELVKCPICFDVVEDAVQVVCCQQCFCKKCMEEWLSQNNNPNIGNCPFDRTRITSKKIVKVPRIVDQLLEALSIKCVYTKNGCPTVCKLSEIESHEKKCNYRSGVLVNCDCGLWISRQDFSHHKCIRFLSQKIEIQEKSIIELQNQLQKMKSRKRSRMCFNRSPILRKRIPKKRGRRSSTAMVKTSKRRFQ